MFYNMKTFNKYMCMSDDRIHMNTNKVRLKMLIEFKHVWFKSLKHSL